jgi:aspartyl-tRNA(Asn)/glutamyl-tRNA(Gln) amidotransferase subunit B
MAWETVIGLEIHAQLAAASKIFSGASSAFGAEPNTQACAVDLGLPGVLPVINEKAIEMAVLFGIAINAEIARHSVFARKNYFYPDLPKGYQISQYEDPIVTHGTIEIEHEDGWKTINITRAHLEEDAGKSLHQDFHGWTGIDLNRAGTPLLEIVSEPDMRSAKEAVAYMREMHRLVRYLGICDGNMQEGSFRCDANVSVRTMGSEELGTRTEIKNLNSFRFVEQAIEYEVERQIDIVESGGSVKQETRLYDSVNSETRSMRSKEDAHDYRYFPDPDLLPVDLTEEYIDALKAKVPELPKQKLTRFVEQYGLAIADVKTLIQDPETATFFESAASVDGAEPKQVANWLIGELFGAVNKANLAFSEVPISPGDLGQLVARIADDTISGKIAKQVFQAMWEGEGRPDEIISSRNLKQVSDTKMIESVVQEVIAENQEQVAQYREGKEKVLGYLVGQVMKKTGGQANPKTANKLIKRYIQ